MWTNVCRGLPRCCFYPLLNRQLLTAARNSQPRSYSTVLSPRKPQSRHCLDNNAPYQEHLTTLRQKSALSFGLSRPVARSVTIMGGNSSKSDHGAGAVQGLHFTSKSETPVPAPPRPSTPPASGEGRRPVSTSSHNMATISEFVVCKVGEMSDGEMREVQLGETKALLVKDQGEYHAVGSKCTHYGAPLYKGAYCNGVVRCPWHGACFSVKTGDIEDYPGLDSLPLFQVEIRGDDVIVKASSEALSNNKRVKAMSHADPDNKQTFVLIGGGAASVTCAETLRQGGFEGRILVLTKENCLPYDRPKLSKDMKSTASGLALRQEEFYHSHDIEFQTGTEVTGLDASKQEVTTSTGDVVKYDALMVATGGRPRMVTIPGHDLENVFVLRTPDDANAIAASSHEKKVVIIGSSFIGLEVAAYLHNKAESVTVVGTSKVALQRVFGDQIGASMTKFHEEKGVKFHMQREIKELRGSGGRLEQVVLSDNTILPADICVLGIGVVPATDFLKGSCIELTNRGFVSVDKHMKTSAAGVFAAGDIVEFPLFINDDQPSNVQHWQMAHQHGRIAAMNMLGKDVSIRSVPYFWTVMYGKSVRYTGYALGYDDVVVHGDMTAPQFVAFYTKGDKVVAVASLASDPIVSQAASLMEQGQTISKSEIIDSPDSWLGRLKEA